MTGSSRFVALMCAPQVRLEGREPQRLSSILRGPRYARPPQDDELKSFRRPEVCAVALRCAPQARLEGRLLKRRSSILRGSSLRDERPSMASCSNLVIPCALSEPSENPGSRAGSASAR
jgi:hypothetical protein